VPKKDEVIIGWRKFYNEELHNLYYSPNTLRMIKSRRMRWIAYGEDGKCVQNKLGSLKTTDHSENLGVDGRIKLGGS
jgi:hypothetical protein